MDARLNNICTLLDSHSFQGLDFASFTVKNPETKQPASSNIQIIMRTSAPKYMYFIFDCFIAFLFNNCVILDLQIKQPISAWRWEKAGKEPNHVASNKSFAEIYQSQGAK